MYMTQSIKKATGGYYTPRINFTCTSAQLEQAQKLFTHDGLRSEVFRRFLSWLLEMMELYGEAVARRIAYSEDDFATIIRKISQR